MGYGANMGLRRLDWRFLLPSFGKLKERPDYARLWLPGGKSELADQARDVGLAEQVICGQGVTGLVDLAAVLAPLPGDFLDRTLESLPRHIGWGGLVYIEVDRRLPGSRGLSLPRLLQRVQQAGLRPQGVWAVRPHFGATEALLPLDIPGPLAWYVHTLYPAATPAQWLMERALWVYMGLENGRSRAGRPAAARLAGVMPCYALLAQAGGANGGWGLQTGGRWRELEQPGLRPALLTPGQDGGNRAVLLPFAPAGRQPLAVLKAPKLPGFNNRNQTEQRALSRLHADLPPDLAAAVPQSLGALQQGEVQVNLESYAPGVGMMRTSGGWRATIEEKLADLRLAAGWLGRFHQATRQGSTRFGEAELEQWVLQPLQAYQEQFGLLGEEPALFDWARRRGRELLGRPFALVWQHRDFNVWNLYRQGDHLSVLDWEGSRTGPALCDLLHFITHWNETARGLVSLPQRLAGFRELFVTRGKRDALATGVEAALARYLQALGLERDLLALLLVYTWVELALRRGEQLRDAGRDRRAREANIFSAYVDVIAAGIKELHV